MRTLRMPTEPFHFLARHAATLWVHPEGTAVPWLCRGALARRSAAPGLRHCRMIATNLNSNGGTNAIKRFVNDGELQRISHQLTNQIKTCRQLNASWPIRSAQDANAHLHPHLSHELDWRCETVCDQVPFVTRLTSQRWNHSQRG